MSLIVNAAVASVNNMVYDLATHLFWPEIPERLALALANEVRAANVIPLINLGILITVVIVFKLKGKLPWLMSTQVSILVLLSAAGLGWLIHPHIINYADARAHASLTIPDLVADVAASNLTSPKKRAELPAGSRAIAIRLMKNEMPLAAVHKCTGFA